MYESNSNSKKKQSSRLDEDHFYKFCLESLGVNPAFVQKEISRWLKEDFGHGDSTLISLKAESSLKDFVILAKSEFVLCGIQLIA